MKHNGWKFRYNTVYRNWRVWVKLILIKIRVFRKKMYFVLIYISQQFLYKASSLHLCIAVILVFICYTISCFWQRQSTQLSCKFWAPHQVQLILWRITLQVEKLSFNRKVYVNTTISKRNVRWQKSTSEIKDGTRFKRRRKKHASKSKPNTDGLYLFDKAAWYVLINPNLTVNNFCRGLQCNCNVTENQTYVYIVHFLIH